MLYKISYIAYKISYTAYKISYIPFKISYILNLVYGIQDILYVELNKISIIININIMQNRYLIYYIRCLI